jgi:cytochrome c
MAREIVLVLALGWLAPLAGAQTALERTVWDGVYSTEQAERGVRIYKDQCEICHAADMRGGPGARGVVGLAFQFLWQEKSLGELFEALRTKMPPGQPGTLTDQEYIDVLAAILQGNALPAGAGTELPAERALLDRIQIIWKKPENVAGGELGKL